MFHLRWPTARWAQGILLGLLATALTGLAGALGWTQNMERDAVDALFGARGPRFPHPKILIIAADNETVARVNEWPLPRSLYAQIVRRLHAGGARVIAVDALFPTLSARPQEDADFARACRDAGNVIQAMAFHVAGAPNAPLPVSLPGDRVGLEKRLRVSDAGARCLNAAWVSSALPELRKNAPAVGHVTVFPETDGTLRRIPHLISYRDELYPSLALAAAASYLGLRPPEVLGEAQGVRLPLLGGDRRVPLDAHGEAVVNWIGGNRSFPTFSVNELLDGDIAPDALKDALVFIGVTAAGAYEQRATPFSPNQPAVELQANAADDILSNRPLREVGPAVAWALIIGFTLLTGFVVSSRAGWGGSLWFAVLAFCLWQGALTALRYDWHLPFAAPLLAGVMVWAAATALNYRQELEENWRADASVSALARGGALLASRQSLPQLQRTICETARQALRAQEAFLLLDGAGDATPSHLEAAAWAKLRAFADDVEETAQLQRLPLSNGRKKHTSKELKELTGELGPILAAPLPRRADNPSEQSLVPRDGVLIALRGKNSMPFNERDEMLLETLAEQAALALSHLDYAEILRSRVELANRELVQTNALLAEQGAKLAAVVQSIHTAIIVTDEKGAAVFFNAATRQVLRDATPPSGSLVAGYLRDCGLAELADLCDRALTEGRQGRAPDLSCETMREIYDAQGEHVLARVVLSAQLTPLHGADGGFLGVMLAIADVTAQRDLDSMKTEFVSFVAHELRSPLTSILGYASLLQNMGDRFPAEQRGEMTGAIMRQGTRLNRMIGELLDVSRLDAGKPLDLQKGPLDLVTLCRTTIENQRAALQGKTGYHLEMIAPESPLLISADSDRMEQIITNFLSNAVKYSPQGGTIRLELENGGNRAIFRISDQGMGMAPEQMTNLFQKFYRTPDARRSGIKGTGLGLYLVKQLIEAHGGSIAVDSSVNRGTTFTVEFPKMSEAITERT